MTPEETNRLTAAFESGAAAMESLTRPEPPPRPQTGTAIWQLVIEDMRHRDAHGERKYGTRLRAGDGRNHLVDAYQEALDLAVYLRQELEERRLRAAEPLPPADLNSSITDQICNTAWDEDPKP